MKYGFKRKGSIQKGRERIINIVAVVVFWLYNRAIMTKIAAVDRIVVIGKLVHKVFGKCAEKKQHSQPNSCDNMYYPTNQNQNTTAKGKLCCINASYQ